MMNKFKLFLFRVGFFIRIQVQREGSSFPNIFLAKSDAEKSWKPYKLPVHIQRQRSALFWHLYLKPLEVPIHLKSDIDEEGNVQLVKCVLQGIDYDRFDIVIRCEMNRLLYWFWLFSPCLLKIDGHLQAKIYYILLLFNGCQDFIPRNEYVN